MGTAFLQSRGGRIELPSHKTYSQEHLFGGNCTLDSSGLRSGRMPSQSIKDMKVSWPTMYSQALVTFDASLLPKLILNSALQVLP